MAELPFINVHTHIFNHKFIPDYPVNMGIKVRVRTIVRYSFLLVILKIIAKIPFIPKAGLKRIISVASIGMGNTQLDVYKGLDDYYRSWGDMRFVVLPMDMEQMGGGESPSNYFTQLQEIVNIRQNSILERKILPFVFIDPRRPEFLEAEDVLAFAKKYIEQHKFMGIKVYPALGYFPFDHRLDALWAWCQERGVPVVSHTIEGTMRYRETGAGNPTYYPRPGYARDFNTQQPTNADTWQRNFTDPRNWEFVLEKYPALKVNLAHYGAEDLGQPGDLEWYTHIRRIISEYINAYTDIAYILHNRNLFPVIYGDMQDAHAGKKILFGTDYYVVQKTKTEDRLIADFRAYCREQDGTNAENTFRKMAVENPDRWLDSVYYRAL